MVNNTGKSLISWEAQEYIQRSKNTGWYIALILVGVALSVLSIFLQWWTFVVLIIVSIIALIVNNLRPPRMVHYSLTDKGIKIGSKTYEYSLFKSFGVMNENRHFSIILIPRKRFAPRTTVYFPENQGEKIVDVFGARLPMKQVEPDALDKIVKFLRI